MAIRLTSGTSTDMAALAADAQRQAAALQGAAARLALPDVVASAMDAAIQQGIREAETRLRSSGAGAGPARLVPTPGAAIQHRDQASGWRVPGLSSLVAWWGHGAEPQADPELGAAVLDEVVVGHQFDLRFGFAGHDTKDA